jgi:subtilase family serine protease
LAALGAGLFAVVLAPASAANWAATPARAFPAMRGAVDLGRAPAALPIHVAIGLAGPNRSETDSIIVRQATPGDPLYHRYLSTAQARALVSPSGTRVAAVANYLARSGFTNVRVTPDNLLLLADGNAGVASRAFATEIHLLSTAAGRFYANTKPALVPVALRGAIVGIEGLHDLRMHSMLVKKTSVQSCTEVPVLDICALSEFGPADFQQVYDATSASTGASTPIAIFGEGDLTQVVADLRTQEQLSHLPVVPVSVVLTGPQSGDTSGADEFDLDTQYSTGMAGNVSQLTIYDAPSLTDADTTTEFDRFVTDNSSKAASASFGECELLADLDGSTATDDAIFKEAALQGQTVFASSGDTGTGCLGVENGIPLGVPGVEYPASSTYVVAAGGTTLLANASGAYDAEIGWYAGGGGTSLVEAAGAWQSGVVPLSAIGRKAVPDIAMDADPDTGANVIVSGSAEEVGGTSLSSPLSLGVWARLETAHANALGFAAPILYKEFSDEGGTSLVPSGLTRAIGGFHDIEFGGNPLPATPGYDYSTGLGTFDVGLSESDILK